MKLHSHAKATATMGLSWKLASMHSNTGTLKRVAARVVKSSTRKGTHEIFDADAFVLVGDASQGIGVTADGITATTYKSALVEGALDEINSMERAELLVAGDIVQEDGFPASEQVATADVWNTGGQGRFGDNHLLPGIEAPPPEFDWAPEGPEGWTKDTSFLEENRPGGPPEYLGWNFLDKDFWIAEQSGQDRAQFELGQSILAIVDPDAYDDFVDIDSDTGDNATDCEPLAPRGPYCRRPMWLLFRGTIHASDQSHRVGSKHGFDCIRFELAG